MPLLLKPLLGFKLTRLAVFLFSVPPAALVNVPRPLLLEIGMAALPSRFQMPALVMVLLLPTNTCAVPVWLRVRVAALVQGLFTAMLPLSVVAESVVRLPLPARPPPLKLLPPASVMLPVPPNVPLLWM